MNKQACLFIFLFIGFTLAKLNAQNFQRKDPAKIYDQQSDIPIRYNITSLGNSSGLISSDISALFQDRKGFIWVGTQSGISKYDGNIFKNFTKIENAFIGRINSIIQNSNGLIIAAGENGLFYYHQGDFHKLQISIKDIKSLHLNGEQLYIGGVGFIPFSLSLSDLDKVMNGQEIEIKSIVENSIWEDKMKHFQVGAMDTDENGELWIASYNRLASFDGTSLKVHWKSDSVTQAFNAVRVINSSTIFWASEDTALILQEGENFSRITEPATYIFANNESSSFFLTTMELLAYKNGKFSVLHVLDEYAHLYTKVMIIDKEGNFWIGAEGNLIKLTPTYFNKWSKSDDSLLHSNHSITQLQNGKILVGSSKENILTINNSEFETFTKLNVHHGSLTAAIRQDENDWLWYASSMSGIVLDRNGTKEIYSEKDGLGNKGQYFFFESNAGELWSGGELGISRIQVNKNERIGFENFMVDEKDKISPLFQSIFQNPDNTIWAASNKGLYRLKNLNLEQWKFPSPISNSPIITSTKIDRKGHLWISTQGEGLWQCYFNDKNEPEVIRQWTVNDGLASNVVLDILVDKQDRIWAASQNGICSLDFRDNEPNIRCFDKIDGWFGEPTSRCRLMESKDGYLWAVGLTEIVSFPLYHLPINQIQPNTFISQVQLFDGDEDIFKYASVKKKGPMVPVDLTLPFDKNFLNFHFSTTSYTKPEKNSFKFQLEGLDPDWKNPISENKVRYAGLQPGEYTFKVMAANNDRIFGENAATFKFKILPPWYKTWWAYLLYAVIIFSIIAMLYTFNINRKLALAESARLKDIDELKNNLFTNITHEFRTPLTVILGMANHLKSNIEDKEFKDAEQSVEMIERNGQNLLKLISEMLDLAKLENNKTELELINGDIIPYIKYLSESFHSMADESNIQLTVYTEVDSLLMDYDVNKISAVVYNLLSNSIKFSDKIDGKIIVHLNKVIQNENPQLVIKIKDNGVGISEENLSEIFNKFYQVNASVSRSGEGTGVGLALTKELVNLMNGTIQVKSAINEGSEFIVSIPITQNATKTRSPHFESKSPIVKSSKIPVVESELFKLPDEPSELPLILLIEDNKDVAHYLEACLVDKYQTIHAINGTIGMETAFEKVPDVIICDVMMPGIDGYEVCKKLKSDERTDHIPIIMLTAKVTIKDRLTGLSQGADAYLTKPFVKAELFTRLDQLINLRKKMLMKMENGNLSALLHKKSQNPEEKFLKKVVQHIHDEIDNHEFGSKQLAMHFNLSESQVYRKLKAISNKSTAIFIRSVRLQKAKELLKSSDKTVSEIAYDVGFNDPSWFSRAFREEFGQPPIEFRR